MGKLKTVVVKYWKVYAAALVIAVICDLIGTVKLNIGIGTLTIFPMVFATIIGGILGPDAFKLFKVPESRLGGSLVLVVLAPFMAKMGVSAGANLSKLVSVGPALILQEFGNLGTILFSLPIALFLGLKKEAIGACYLLRLDSDTFYIYHVAAVMVDNLRRLLLGINLSDKAVMDFDFPGVGFPV